MKRILIINVNWLGDVLFTTPFIRALRTKYPQSQITCMLVPRVAELLEDNPDVDEVMVYDEYGEHKSLLGKLRLINFIRSKRFDTAFILHRSFTRALFTALAGIKERIGYDTKKRGFLLTKAVEEPSRAMHKIEYFLNLARACGADATDEDYNFFVADTERQEAETFLRESGIGEKDLFIVLNPGGNWMPKRWPKKNFAELADKLSYELGAKVVITGAPSDRELVRDIIDITEKKPIDASGKTTLKRLGAVMEQADLVVSSDSGPMHLALSVNSRVIALFGPTSDSITGPYGTRDFKVIKKDIDCEVPCYNRECDRYRCMEAITVDDVLEKAKEMLLAEVTKEV